MTLHFKSISGENPHHVLEAVFKGLGRALRTAVGVDPAARDVPSTKGNL
jgi:imidazoleglycerol-phosphate dehydratase